MERIKDYFLYVTFICVCSGFWIYGSDIWEGVSSRLAEGQNLWWLSIGVFLTFVVWQARGIYDFFNSPNKVKFRRGTMTGIMVISTLGFLYTMLLNYLAHNGGDAAKTWALSQAQNGTLIEDTSILSIVVLVVLTFFFTVVAASFLFCMLLFGRVGLGASLGVAIHNWANGAALDFKAVIEVMVNLFAEISLSDVSGIIFGIIWFLVSQYLLKSPNTAALDAAA